MVVSCRASLNSNGILSGIRWDPEGHDVWSRRADPDSLHWKTNENLQRGRWDPGGIHVGSVWDPHGFQWDPAQDRITLPFPAEDGGVNQELDTHWPECFQWKFTPTPYPWCPNRAIVWPIGPKLGQRWCQARARTLLGPRPLRLLTHLGFKSRRMWAKVDRLC